MLECDCKTINYLFYPSIIASKFQSISPLIIFIYQVISFLFAWNRLKLIRRQQQCLFATMVCMFGERHGSAQRLKYVKFQRCDYKINRISTLVYLLKMDSTVYNSWWIKMPRKYLGEPKYLVWIVLVLVGIALTHIFWPFCFHHNKTTFSELNNQKLWWLQAGMDTQVLLTKIYMLST